MKPRLISNHLTKPETIIRIEASSNYSKIYFATGYPLTVAKVLRWFQLHLPPGMFSRVHRSHLLNNMHIVLVKGNTNNTLVLSNGDSVVMSRRQKTLKKQLLFRKSNAKKLWH